MEINPWSVWPKSSETWLLFNCNLNLPFWPGSCIIPQNAAYIPITVSNHTGDYYSSWKVDNYETGREKATVLRLYLTRLHLATNVRWRFGEDRPSIFSPMWLWMFCRLFVVASTLTVYTHMLDLERSHRKWCHGPKMSCLLPACHKAGIFFRAYLLLLINLASCFPTRFLTHPHLPASQHFCPHTYRKRRKDFCSAQDENSLPLCDLLCRFLFSLLFCIYLQPPSVWPDHHRKPHHASPRLKSPALRTCLWTSNKTVMPLTACHLTVAPAQPVTHG